MTELMRMVAPQQLWVVSGIYEGDNGRLHAFDEGTHFAAVDQKDAEEQAVRYWTGARGYDKFEVTISECIKEVDGFKVVLVEDEQA